MDRRVGLYGKVKPYRGGAVAKASVKCATMSRAGQTRNPCDLPMGRLKVR